MKYTQNCKLVSPIPHNRLLQKPVGLLYDGFWSIIKKNLVQGYQDLAQITPLMSDSVLAPSFLCGEETRIVASGHTLGEVSIIFF